MKNDIKENDCRLIASHNIFLNNDERESLFRGETIQTTGVYVPVWFKRGNTTEPASEIFCKYKIKVNKKNISLKKIPQGFEIGLPGENQEKSIKSLLDISKGGSEFLHYLFKTKDESIHCLEIKTIELLKKSLTVVIPER